MASSVEPGGVGVSATVQDSKLYFATEHWCSIYVVLKIGSRLDSISRSEVTVAI